MATVCFCCCCPSWVLKRQHGCGGGMDTRVWKTAGYENITGTRPCGDGTRTGRRALTSWFHWTLHQTGNRTIQIKSPDWSVCRMISPSLHKQKHNTNQPPRSQRPEINQPRKLFTFVFLFPSFLQCLEEEGEEGVGGEFVL